MIPLYVLEEPQPDRPLGAASRWWLDKSLASLGRDIGHLGGELVLRRGPAIDVLEAVVAEAGARQVVWNRRYEPVAAERDRQIRARLENSGVEVREFNASLLNEPRAVRTAASGPFKVFSAYWRAAAPKIGDVALAPSPKAILGPSRRLPSDALEAWDLHPRKPDWSRGFSVWCPGEQGAHARLDRFLDDLVATYAQRRDRPEGEWTSRLSPHLHFGEIGPRQVWAAACAAHETGRASAKGVETFLKELGWREFNHHLICNFPNSVEQNLDRRFDAFAWREDSGALHAWREGRTGYPIVDAGMRELWTTGWMHNRVRMIVASFLVKDLLIDWRVGEAWFWDTLVDADLANNVGNWQWTAGSGADAAPFFRVFNPVLQGERFDPEGKYVRRWVPELAQLGNDCIHKPWTAGPSALTRAGVRLGDTYPRPIVDHAAARARALGIYRGLA